MSYRWGPLGLNAAELAKVIERLTSAAEAVFADVTVLRQKQVNVATMGDAGTHPATHPATHPPTEIVLS